MTNKKDFLEFQKVLNLLLTSGFLSSSKQAKHIKTASFLDAFYNIMSIKELIRNIDYIKNNPQSKIYVYIENRYLRSLASLLLTELKFANNVINIITLSRNLDKSFNDSSMLLVLGEVNKKFCVEAIRNNVHLFHFINDTSFQPITGHYNMYNKISDMTKLVFIFALIDQLFSTRVETASK